MLAATLFTTLLATSIGFGPGPKGKDIVKLAASTPDLSTLVTALTAAGLTDMLTTAGPFTVFAPSNEAFAKLDPAALALLLQKENIGALQQVLTYHVHLGQAFSKDLKNGQEVSTIEKDDVKVTIVKKTLFKPGSVKINDATVTTADVTATNGVVHIIDSVLVPPNFVFPKGPQNLVELAAGNPDYSTLVTALRVAGLVETLSGPGPFTVLAPTNEAFAKLPAGVLTNLLKPSNKALLVKLLTYHVIPGAVNVSGSGGSIPSGFTTTKGTVLSNGGIEQGDTIRLFRPCTDRQCKRGSRVFVNQFRNQTIYGNGQGPKGNGQELACGYGNYASCYEAQITSKDNQATNGVIQGINTVLSLEKHVWFSTIASGACCHVDANDNQRPRVPLALLEPSAAKQLKLYVDLTVKFYTSVKLEAGNCPSKGYSDYQGTRQGSWVGADATKLMSICKLQCGCDYGYGPSVNKCPDAPDDPSKGKFCSLCGPTYNYGTYVKCFNKDTTVMNKGSLAAHVSTLE